MRRCASCGQFEAGMVFPCHDCTGHDWQEIGQPAPKSEPASVSLPQNLGDWLDSFLAMLSDQGLSYCPECMNIAADADEGDTSCQHEARPLTPLERDHAREYIVATLTLRSTGDGNG